MQDSDSQSGTLEIDVAEEADMVHTEAPLPGKVEAVGAARRMAIHLSSLADVDDLEPIEVERNRSMEHIAKMQDLVMKQADVFHRIRGAIEEKANDDLAETPLVVGHTRRCSTAPCYAGDLSLQSEKGLFNPSRMLNSLHVAHEIGRENVSKERFQRRRRQIMQEGEIRNEAMKQKHDIAEKRTRLRKRELFDKQAEKSLARQQKRMEQNKIVHELQKQQDHEMQQAIHKLAKKLEQKHSTSAAKSEGSSAQPLVLKAEALKRKNAKHQHGVLEEPVYKQMTESHTLYDSTLGKWHSFVAENEKRSEAYWEKMLRDPDAKKRRERCSSKMSVGSFKKAVQDIASVRRFMSRASKSSVETPERSLEPGSEWNFEDLSSPGTSQVFTSTQLSGLSPDAYAARLARVKSHQQELERKAMEKAERDKQFLEKKRQKYKEEQEQKLNRCKSYNLAWLERNDDSMRRREQMNTSNEGEMLCKLDDRRKQQEASQAQRDEELRCTSQAREEKRQMAKDSAQRQLESTTAGFVSKIETKVAQAESLLKVRLEVAVERQDAGDEKATTMKSQKEHNDRAFVRSVLDDIGRKEERHEQAKYFQTKPSTPLMAFDRFRVLRNKKDEARSHNKLAAIDPISITSPCAPLEDLSVDDLDINKSPMSAMNRQISDISKSPMSPMKRQSSPFLDPMQPLLADDTLKRASSKSLYSQESSSPRPRLGSALSQADDTMKRASSKSLEMKSRASSMNEKGDESPGSHSSDAEGEKEFLENLQARSQKWLGKLRTDSL